MTASAIAARLLTSAATSEKGINTIIYIILGTLLVLSIFLGIIAPPEAKEEEIYQIAINEIKQTGVDGDINFGTVKTIYLLHYFEFPENAQQINEFVSSFFISKNESQERFMTKAEMLDRIRLSPFNFDDIEYNTVYLAFYATLPGIGENGDGNGNNSGSGGGSNGITPPILSCSLKMPCTGSITSAWGYRESPITPGKQELHTGMDISGEWHQPIYATFAGEVISASTTKSGYGNFVQIKHSSDNITFYSFYAHLSKLSVSVGDVLKIGQQIGLEGGNPRLDDNPGDTTGHHLHFELRLQPNLNSTFDPFPYLTE